MARRDPRTGQFVSSDVGDGSIDWQRVQPVHITHEYSIPAADLTGATAQTFGDDGSFRNDEIIDMEEVIDRDEIALVRYAELLLWVALPSTQTADGHARAEIEVGFDGGQNVRQTTAAYADVADSFGTLSPEESSANKATITDDVIGRKLIAHASAAFSDGATGVGGAGSPGKDHVEVMYPMDGPSVDQRDDLMASGTFEAQNVDDGALHVELTGVVWFERFPHPLAG